MKPLKIVFISVIFLPVFLSAAYALNLDNLRNYFLNGEYKICVAEGEKILAQAASSKDLEELYYILGLSYLKEGNYLRASDIFEILLKEFHNGKFKEEAEMGLGDTYFARRDYSKAESVYREILKNYSHTKLKPAIYYRLSQLGKRTANSGKEQEYLLKLKSEFPHSPEVLAGKKFFPETANAKVGTVAEYTISRHSERSPHSLRSVQSPGEAKNLDDNKILRSAGVYPEPSRRGLPQNDESEVLQQSRVPETVKSSSPIEQEIISGAYSIQVGAFSSLANAKSLTLNLKAQGYSSYVSEALVNSKKIYKIRIGGFSGMREAQAAEKKLQSQGYTVKIIP
ncbi:MAG: SPOR domain-containing protein [Candidatus Omnitrophota bacterium]